MNIEKMREEFEAWWFDGVYPLRRMDRFEDAGVSEEMAQEIWQASRAAIEIELPKLSGLNSSFVADGIQVTREHNRYNAGVDDCRKAIKAAGLKVKS